MVGREPVEDLNRNLYTQDIKTIFLSHTTIGRRKQVLLSDSPSVEVPF
jgi:hypothetical protein